MQFEKKVELAAIAGGGLWSLATVLLFATGKYPAAYSMLAIGTVATTSLAIVQVFARPDAPLPGSFELAEDV